MHYEWLGIVVYIQEVQLCGEPAILDPNRPRIKNRLQIRNKQYKKRMKLSSPSRSDPAIL